MKWVKFLVITILIFAIALLIIYGAEVWDAIKAFPLDWVGSYLLGAITMIISGIQINKKDDSSEEDEWENSPAVKWLLENFSISMIYYLGNKVYIILYSIDL